MRVGVVVGLLALGIGGCGLTESQRKDIIDSAGRVAGAEAFRLTFEKLRSEGVPEEAAAKLADAARQVAEAKAREIAERTTPTPSSGAGWKGILGTVLTALVNAGAASLERRRA